MLNSIPEVFTAAFAASIVEPAIDLTAATRGAAAG
jgi:hypothetical protein